MKNLLILMLLAFSFNLSANAVKDVIDSATTVATNVANEIDTSKVSKQIYTDIRAGIAGLATGLKVSAEKVWDILVLQQLVYSIVFLILGILSFISILFWIKAWKKEEMSSQEITTLTILRLIQVVVSLITLITFTFNISDIVTGFINPEYGAIQEIVKFVNK